MTAEIAILNKSAIALATDSAVTISAGKQEQKIYDSADKLFDLSYENPIGIMIYNGMQFMEIPLQNIISDYRQERRKFDRLEDAAHDFLCYLSKCDVLCTDKVNMTALHRVIAPVLERMRDRINGQIEKLFTDDVIHENIADEIKSIFTRNVNIFQKIYADREKSDFVGSKSPRITKKRELLIADIASTYFSKNDEELWEKIISISRNIIIKKAAFSFQTGIVIAGFGNKDLFPTLVSFEIDGILFGKLKYSKTNFVDIDRGMESAKVIPFAQKEMVERFLYGLDTGIERNIQKFLKNTISTITDEVLDQLDMSQDDRESLTTKARNAESAFIDKLQEVGFNEIRSESRSAIEDMVEFMPKPELATMAEALVNLTSIKRRVSRGMETVGGPIDVAVISRADGFIWVKRKHYFSSELNPRYAHRVHNQIHSKPLEGDD
ncbi:MAG: hypothetical protein P1V13_25845 [Rhizobiaceae bacterium]|nr:hypothetical protein [Rhizobiaceae bacterium]